MVCAQRAIDVCHIHLEHNKGNSRDATTRGALHPQIRNDESPLDASARTSVEMHELKCRWIVIVLVDTEPCADGYSSSPRRPDFRRTQSTV